MDARPRFSDARLRIRHGAFDAPNATVHPPGPLQRRDVARNKNAAPVVVQLALEWMRGKSLEAILADFDFVGGYPAGIVLRAEIVRPVVVVGNE